MWSLWVVDENENPLTPGAAYDSQLKAYIRAGKFLVACGSKLEDLKVSRVELFGEKTLVIKDPCKDWGIATLESI